MPLFQNVVLKKHIQSLNNEQTQQAYQKLTSYFHHPDIQANIRAAKEEQFQEGFLRELFVKILGYTINPEQNYTLTTEFKNQKGAKKADGAIVDSQKIVKAVIELKSTKTIDLDSIENQAFGYKNNQKNCRYVITSNFEKIRFYIDNAIDFIEWNLFTLTQEQFNELYSLLHQQYLLADIPIKIKETSLIEEETITKQLYAEYSYFRKELFQSLIANNPNIDKLVLFKKTQKLLDRFLFLFFAEDKLLIPANSVRGLLNSWDKLKEDPLAPQQPLYHRFKSYFYYLNFGFKNKTHEIFAYNGGLFAPDDIIDNLVIDDKILYHSCAKLSDYDYDSEIDVNILGHIFEHSLSEIEELETNIIDPNNKTTKRKKDGIFYTPRYITKYIIENTVGVLCAEQKYKIELKEEDYIAKLSKTKQKPLLDKLNAYKAWLLQLTIIDPACGSGAFLNQALEFLIAEHRFVAELEKKLTGSSLVFDIENSILEHNLFGVDINEESVEIAKLSLWLRTAMPNRKLTSLSNNIKCGNSLIDDATVAGDKAFNWQSEFKHVFDKGGFDVVIGNPPYGASVSSLDKKFYDKKYQTTFPNYDTYGLFFEKSLLLLKKNGYLGFITPNTFLVIENGYALRSLLFEKVTVKTLLESFNVFPDAVVEPITIIIRNNTPSKTDSFYSLLTTKRDKTTNYFIENNNKILFTHQDLTERKDLIFNYRATLDNRILAKKIESNSVSLGSISKITAGVKPYEKGKGKPPQTKDILENKPYTKVLTEDIGWKKLIRGTQINRYSLTWEHEYINYGEWLAAPRNPESFSLPKIFIRRTDDKILSVFDENGYIGLNSVHCLKIIDSSYHYLYLNALLNSMLFKWYFQFQNFHMVNKPLAEVKVVFIERLPIKKATNQNVFIECVLTILASHQSLQTLTTKFKNYFCNQYQLQKLNTKLDNWHTLSFAEFIAELNKAIKTNKGKALTKKDEFEWIDLFEDNKKQAQTLQQQIAQTDQQIDQMVYNLYQLTPEEIAIVEGNAT
jgi:type I restriction-modification system DNA methylase subunit